jgi:hypothetical protein
MNILARQRVVPNDEVITAALEAQEPLEAQEALAEHVGGEDDGWQAAVR